MDDNSEILLKKICCTCLSVDRKLNQLYRLNDGVNNLYLLLSYDSEAYREGFYKDTASLYICWECRAIMDKISRFRQQACVAQRTLTNVADGKLNIKSQPTLSHLTTHHSSDYNQIINENDNITTNFIDCGPNIDIKEETDDEIPLSELTNWPSENEQPDLKIKSKIKKRKKKKELSYFSTASLSETELKEVLVAKRLTAEFADSEFKCDSCVEVFQDGGLLDEHNLNFHIEKPDHIKCCICCKYIKEILYEEHRNSHYIKYICFCNYSVNNKFEIVTHLVEKHNINVNSKLNKKKACNKDNITKSDSRKTDKKTPYGYLCKECNKYFENKNQRWKHIQREHREGYKCPTCDKRFAFRSTLARHEETHAGSPARTECDICHKHVRVSLAHVHARTHAPRDTCTCAPCGKTFVSRASYLHHLKYTSSHAVVDVLKYKCPNCEKGYRSRAELRDHVNYQHMGKTQHKCPICEKALATKRCITRHVKRAHDGIKESARDKICQQCGKAFRDKKGLREHELIHSGARPLSCEVCGGTFRQSASLYTHKRRVHKLRARKRDVQLITQP